MFKGAEKRKIKTPTGDEVDLSVSIEEAELKTPVISLGLSTRARNALERANVITVRDLLNFPIREIHMMRGVGNQTRQEIIRCVAALKERFPNIEGPAEEILGTPTLETLRNRILGTKAGKKETDWNIRCGLLGFRFSVFGPKTENRKPKTTTGPARPMSLTPCTSARHGSIRPWRRIGLAGAKTRSSPPFATSCASRFKSSAASSRSPS